MNNDKIITFEIPKGYKFKQRISDEFVFEKMNDRTTDIIEASEILDISIFQSENYRKEQLEALQKLLIFRDAWWKMADDWKPDWNNVSDKHCIYFISGEIWLTECQTRQCTLAFPTAEMRDAFYDNFKDLIKQCKELL